MSQTCAKILVRVHGSPALPTLIYLPGIHGDWTLVTSFREALAGQLRFVELCYPRTTTWSLDEYAEAIEQELLAVDVRSGWLLGESFGSQPAWQMIERRTQRAGPIAIQGLILAGGFVKHPWPWGACFLRGVTGQAPRWLVAGLLRGYARYARFRHRHAPGTLGSIAEFVTNRRHPDDPAAMQHRYTLVAENDLRPTARAYAGPVCHLAGLVDPIVPNALVRHWLKRNCPGFRASHTIRHADHNVLGTAPAKAAEMVLNWMLTERAELDHPTPQFRASRRNQSSNGIRL